MRILKFQRNKMDPAALLVSSPQDDNTSSMDSPQDKNVTTMHFRQTEKGFTILECIIAIGILSSVIASLIVLQTSIVYIAQNSMDKLKATWSIKQAEAQLDYLLDSAGFAGVNENSSFEWLTDKNFKVNIQKKDLIEVKPSQFLMTAIKFYNLNDPSGSQHLDVERALAPAVPILDNTPLASTSALFDNKAVRVRINSSPFINIVFVVNWLQGKQNQTFQDGLFLMDNYALASLQIPNFTSNGNGSGSSTNPGAPN